MLPLIGYFYGPLEVEEQSFAIKINELICEPDMDIENNSTIESQLYNLNQNQNTHYQSVNERLNKLEVNKYAIVVYYDYLDYKVYKVYAI